MSKEPHPNPFVFLTEDRRTRFTTAIKNTNRDCLEHNELHARKRPFWGKKVKSDQLRNFLLPNLRIAFAGDSGVKVREKNGIVMLTFDDEFVLHFKKLNPTTDGSTPLGTTPKTIKQAKMEYWVQMPLWEEDENAEIPLGKLYDIIAGHVTNDGDLIVEYIFNDQDGIILLNSEALDLGNHVSDMVADNEEEEAPKTTFRKRKGDLKDASNDQS